MTNIFEITEKIKSGKTTATEQVAEALKKAKSADEKYHIFISLQEKEALDKAKQIDEKIAKGEEIGALAGVPFVIKDNFLTTAGKTTAASKMLEPFHSPLTATSVQKLEAEGAIVIGRTNLDSFAHGGSTENSYFGPTKNSKDLARVSGGSSGGSAVATALDIVPFALGTDTGGSIRQPASYNGVYGIKPTFGTVSRFGVVAMASSTDTIGCFAKTAKEADLVMSIMSGQDKNDPTALADFYQSAKTTPKNTKNLRIAIIRDFMSDSIDPEVRATTLKYAEKAKKLGAEITEIDMPILKYAIAMYYIIVPAEIASNLSRFDGIRYGHRSDKTKSLSDIYGQSRNEGFMPENKRRIMIGNFVLSSGFFDAYYLKAQKARTLLIDEYDKIFENFDFILTPVAPTPAFKIGENSDDPIKMYLEDAMTVPPSLAGLPAISAPAGRTKSGLDIGVQIIGPRRSDKKILKFAEDLENV